jgi:hypothetical protein
MRKKLLRLVRIAPLALLFASAAFAQTTGTLIGVVTDASTGKPVAGAVIVARSPNLQGEQTAVTDANGSYRISLLPPGEYTLAVQLEGYKPAERSDLTIRMDKTIRANLAVVPEAVRMEEQVVRTGTAPVVNIGSAESGAVISREFVANVPVGRTVEAVSATVPTASSDLYGVGFAGAQSAENAYILDGLNVTDPVYGTFGANPTAQIAQPTLLTNFIQEVDVKTGGFQPEYGRTTGGVLNMVTRSGSNEFHGSLFGNFTPRMWIQPTGQTAGAAGEAVAWRSKPSEGAYDLDFGFEAGGPVMKDKLWFYAGFAPVISQRRTERFLRSNVLTTDAGAQCDAAFSAIDPYGRCVDSAGNFVQNRIPGTDSIVKTSRTTYQITGKLTYLLDENNNFTVSAFGMPSTTSNYNMNGAEQRRVIDTDDNIIDVIGRYAGKYLDKKLIFEVVTGYHRSTSKDQPTQYQQDVNAFRFREDMNLGLLDPKVFDACGGATADPARCTVLNYIIGGSGYVNDTKAERLAGRVSGSYLAEIAGSHNMKVGLDVERSTYHILKDYGGPDGYFSAYPASLGAPRLSSYRVYGHVTDPAAVDGFAHQPNEWISYKPETTSVSTNTAVFAQDSWQLPVANVTLNYGIRWEGQRMENNDNPSQNGFDINNNWAPRVQAIWDFTGNGRGKAAGNWGRFFYNIPLDMGDRAFGAEQTMNYRLNNTCSGFSSAFTGASPTGVQAFDPRNVTAANCGLVARTTATAPFNPWYVNTTGVTATPVDPNVQGVYVDQFGGQLEYEVLPDLSLGFEYNGRRQGQAIEDMSSDDGNNYYIGNPGYSKPFTIGDVTYDSKTVTTFDDATGREVKVPFPKPERSYDGFTVFARKNFSKGWIAQVAYTYSKLRGNLPGVFRPETGQLDPGITSEYDLASLMANRKGLLPGDQTHAVKLYGAYTVAFSPRFNATAGAAYTGASGTPVSALGSHPLYGDTEAFVLPRGMAGRTPWVNQVDLRGALEYVIKPPYALKVSVDLFNIFNTQDIVYADENYTFDTVQPVSGINCTTSAPSAKVPWQKLQQDCPDLKYLKTVDGRSVQVNKNWGRALPGVSSYQVPITMRLGVALSF